MIVSDIINAVAWAFEVHPRDLIGTARFQFLMRPRFALYTVLHRRGMSLKQTGQVCGGRDHSTVIYGIKRAEHMMERDPEFKSLVDQLTKIKAYRVTLLTEDDDESHSLHTV